MKMGLSLPTDVELEYISQSRSDHCNHNTFRGLFRYKDLSDGRVQIVDNLFKTCIEAPTLKVKEEKPWVVSVLWDNAGVARFNTDHNYVITGETHNSPSNMEAYGGSLTGIVGIYRDPMGTGKGAKLILGTYGFCVGPRDYAKDLKPHLHPRRLLDGVIEGVKDGGNKSGIPTPYGLLYFDDSYMGKCLVFVTALGIMPASLGKEPSHTKKTSKADLIIMSGGRVGKDGIHGVTASSEIFTEHTPAGHVQIGAVHSKKNARLNGQSWGPVIAFGQYPGGYSIGTIEAFQDDLYLAGNFVFGVGGVSAPYIARMTCSGCYADCDGSGALSAADFACFQSKFVTKAAYADCTQDYLWSVADFGCFQTRFVQGCP